MKPLSGKALFLISAYSATLFSFSAFATTPIDIATLKKSSKNVCDYVAQAYSHESEMSISSSTGVFVTSDGKKINVRLGWGGTCGGVRVEAEKKEDGSKIRDFYIPNGPTECSPDLTIVSFQGKDYILLTVNEIPKELSDPSKGAICSFHVAANKPYLIEDKAPALCERILTGSYPNNIQWTPLLEKTEDGSADDDVGMAGGSATYVQTATVNLDGKPTRFGDFIFETTSRPCDQSGVLVWDENIKKETRDAINKSIMDAQERCIDARSSLKEINGDTFIEASGGGGNNYHHILLKYENGNFNLICKTNPGMIVSYTSIKK